MKHHKVKKTSKYEKWFIAQFGKRPHYFNVIDIRDEIQQTRFRLRDLELRLREAEDWDNKFSACLYAWNVRKETR